MWVKKKNIAVLFHLYFVTKNGVNCRSAVSKNWKCEMHKLAILAKLFKFFFWRTTSRQTPQIRLVYATDNFFKWLGPYITHSPFALPFHPIQGKRRERSIKIHCRVIWRRNWRCLGLSWKMHGFCSVAKKTRVPVKCEIERNETKPIETKRIEIKRNEIKRNEIKRNEIFPKRNVMKKKE